MDGTRDAPEHSPPVYGRSPVFWLLLPLPGLSGFSFSPWVCGRVSSFGFSVIVPPCGSNLLNRAAFQCVQKGPGRAEAFFVVAAGRPSTPKQCEEQDDRQGNADQPQQCALSKAHRCLHSCVESERSRAAEVPRESNGIDIRAARARSEAAPATTRRPGTQIASDVYGRRPRHRQRSEPTEPRLANGDQGLFVIRVRVLSVRYRRQLKHGRMLTFT